MPDSPDTPLDLQKEALILARFITGWWPGLEDGLRWPESADDPSSHYAYASAAKILKACGVPLDV